MVIKKLTAVFSLKRLFLIYSIPLVLVLSLLSIFEVMEKPDLFFLDQAFHLRGTETPAPEIAIVAVSEQDFARGAPRWPWPRSLMARLIDQVGQHQPAVIAIDILYTERSNTETVITRERFDQVRPFLYQVLSGVSLEIQTREGVKVIGPGLPGFDQLVSGSDSAKAQDLELAAAVRNAVDQGIDVVLAAQSIAKPGVAGIAEPYQELALDSGGSIALVGVRPDSDGVLRNYLPYGRDKDGEFVYGMALAAVADFKGVDLPETPDSNGNVPVADDLRVEVVDGQFLVNFRGPPGTYPTLEARDVLRGEDVLSGQLKDKIVFIGVTDPSVEDVIPTPFSGTDRMAGVEFHAAAADTLLSGSFIAVMPRYQLVLILVVLGLASIALGRLVRPLIGIMSAVTMLAALFGAWVSAFQWADYSLPITAPLAAVVVGFAFSLTDRVGVEQVEKQQARSMLSRYLPPGIVREMLKDPVAAQLGGKRAELTVLFSDIRGFTTISERLAPEEVVTLLNQYLTVMTEIIFRHGGTVDKFEGDAILAFFGAPEEHDDDPERAVRTALEMRDSLGELEHEWRRRADAPLQIGIAINSGQAVVGNIGSLRRMDYTVIGDPVNLASRLQELTKEFEASVLISGSTYDQVKDMCQTRFLGPVEVRGRVQPVDLYEVFDLNVVDAVEEAPAPPTPTTRE